MAEIPKKVKEQKSIEQTIWDSAEKLRGAVEPAEYKHVVLSLIFLKYANDKFDQHREAMKAAGQEAFLEMMPFYVKDNVFFIPETARWNYIMENAKQPDIALIIDTALHEIESKNASLAGALPDNYYSRLHLDKNCLASLLDIFNRLRLNENEDKDVFGRVYEYCLSQFAYKEGQGKGEFYSPRCLVKCLCELIEPYSGIVYDGAMGSGGMFVQSMKFIEEHKGNRKNISIYGQEYTDTTRRLAKMNLAIRGISANLGETAANTFFDDQHKDLKVDFCLENPPFNQKLWRQENELLDDPRWRGYPIPPVSNANFAWLMNTLSKLGAGGVGAVLLANGSLSVSGIEGEIRKQMVCNDVVDAVITFPGQLFFSTGIPVSAWIIRKGKNGNTKGRTLFIDARDFGHMIDRRIRELSIDDIKVIADTYHSWRTGEGFKDIEGLCKSATVEEIEQQEFVLTPGRYVGIKPTGGDTECFDEKMTRLTSELYGLFKESHTLEMETRRKLAALGYSED